MTVSMKGDPDVVRAKMNLNQDPPPTEESGDQEKRVLEALAHEGHQFHVKRVLPREWQGREARIVVYSDDTPMLYQDIVDEVREHSGGKKYRLTVIDPTTGKNVAAKTFTIDADPKLKEQLETDDSEMMKAFNEGSGDEALAAVDKSFERQVKLAERRVTLEQHQEMLESLKRKRETKGVSGEDNARIVALERSIQEDRHAREIERVRHESDQRIRDIEAKLNAKPQGQDSQFTQLLAQLAEDRKASERRWEQMLQQQREDKANEILRELRASKASGGAGSFKEQMELFGSVAKLFGMRVPGSDDDDDDDEDDDRPWYEKLGTALGEKFLPKLLDKFDSMEKDGKKVTKDEFMKEIDAYATQAAEQAAAKEKEKLEKERGRGLPAPAPRAAAPPAAPAKELPPPAPAAEGAPAPEATPPAPTATPPGTTLTIEQETALNVAGVMALIEREIQMRKQFYQWNYEGAWENLNEDILEKVCTAPDPTSMFDAFKVPGVDPAKLEEMKTAIGANQKMLAWLKRGHDELRDWWAKKLEDPSFDPGDEEEAPEEEQS